VTVWPCGCVSSGLCTHVAPQLHVTERCATAQRNLELLEKNIAALDAKLAHEQGKLATYGADLQAAEAKCACY
jgi:multidrug resistance efflux pump